MIIENNLFLLIHLRNLTIFVQKHFNYSIFVVSYSTSLSFKFLRLLFLSEKEVSLNFESFLSCINKVKTGKNCAIYITSILKVQNGIWFQFFY